MFQATRKTAIKYGALVPLALFTAAQAAQKYTLTPITGGAPFTAAQAAQKS